MKNLIIITLLLCSYIGSAQVNYGTPPKDSCPEKLKDLPRLILVNHFPKINDPVKIKDSYYWKHATSVLCKSGDVTIVEYGAYLYYNNTWNLRQSYPLKELAKNFRITKQKLKQGEPYTWTNNWRISDSLFGGWALWYFIGTTADGETVCGYEMIHTTDNLLN